MADERITQLEKERKQSRTIMAKGFAKFISTSLELAKARGESEIGLNWRLKLDSTVGNGVGKDKTEKKAKPSTKQSAKVDSETVKPKPVEKKQDFECKASEITGEPCQSGEGPVEKAKATLYNKRRYPTCKKCKKAAAAIAKAAKQSSAAASDDKDEEEEEEEQDE